MKTFIKCKDIAAIDAEQKLKIAGKRYAVKPSNHAGFVHVIAPDLHLENFRRTHKWLFKLAKK